jgi:hypothetical protein
LRRARFAVAALCALSAGIGFASTAQAEFPYEVQGGNPHDYTTYKLPAGRPIPNDLNDKRTWMYASTPEAQPNPVIADKRELDGVRGAWVADADRDAPQAWHNTTGRPDVTIAVLDSGIMWNEAGKPMNEVRKNTRISTGETPLPQADRATSTDPLVASCAALEAREGQRDLNNDGVFNVIDYACDSRVDPDPPKGVGLPHLDPQDVLIAFTDENDDDDNGYVDDIVGWDFLDDDNDPFDDVQYGHGSGEAQDSVGEANNGGDLGTCPNCMQIHLRVGTSFIADVNRFALATIYAADNDVDVVQEALGTINKSRLGFDAIKYAYEHGVTVIASAADEAAQHHNWPSSYPYSIVVNSVTHADTDPTQRTSYLMFNGCTNFSSRITLAIPSVSCSSDATGRAAGMAGLVYAAALNARAAGKLHAHPDCRRTDGTRCVITPNEVRQVMASGTFDGVQASDDVNFAQDPATGAPNEPSCAGMPTPGCTDPFFALTGSAVPRLSAPESYPARKGHDQFYGYGRVNMDRTVDQVHPPGGEDSRIPPEVEITSPSWYDMIDPAGQKLTVAGEVFARGGNFKCEVYVAPGAYPHDGASDDLPPGDFVKFPGGACNGQQQSAALNGTLAEIPIDDIEALFPPTSTGGSFDGPEGGPGGQTPNPTNNVGRPNDEPYSFTVKVIATTVGATPVLTGTDRTQPYLHRDADMIDGFPMQLAGDIEASPVLADLDGDNRNELVVGNSDGLVHAFRRDGGELPGWPVKTDVLPLHPQSRAFDSGAIAEGYGAVLTTPAIGDLDHDGTLEVVVGDLERKMYVFDGETGARERKIQSRVEYSGKPLAPFENVRGVDADGNFNNRLGHLHRTQHGFIGSAVLADVDQDDGGKLEIVAASMDRHVYVWNDDGTDVPGWPLVVTDRRKLRAQQPQFDPVTHRPFYDFAKFGGETYDQGAIIATPAVGNLDADPKPEIVVGTNESYQANSGGPPAQGGEPDLNAGGLHQAAYAPLGSTLAFANGRLYAIQPEGDPDGDPNSGDDPWLAGWPFRVGILQAGVLPLVGEGITGAPVIGTAPCQGATAGRRIGVIPAAGVPYVVNPDGQSCYGRDPNGKDIGLDTEGGLAQDPVFLAAFGNPAFADLAGGTAFVAPAAGVTRAADVVLPEYQGGQDYLVAWDLQQPQGKVKQGWPGVMNDLQFLTGPSIAEFGSSPGEEVVNGSAHHDLQAFTSAGTKLPPGWPKLTGDWSVANPTIGSFGTLDTDASAKRLIIHGTRNGRLLAYDTGAGPCGAASWPKFHHDNANSGDKDRDAENPGKPADAAVTGDKLEFTSPGEDLMCGKPAAYEARTSTSPITAASFNDADAITAAGPTVNPGAKATLTLPAEGLKRYVAVRAVDAQGNVGRPASVDRGAQADTTAPPSGGETPGGGSTPGGPTQGNPGTGGVQGNQGRARCLSRTSKITARGIGLVRIGQHREDILRRAGKPSREPGGVMRYCVSGGGRVIVVLGGDGRARLIVTTAGAHIKTLPRKRPRNILVRKRMTRISWAAVLDRKLVRNRGLRARYLRRTGL